MKYGEFIEALGPLVEAAQTLFDREELDEGPDFRRWRQRATDLVQRIRDEGYTVNTAMAGRHFDEPYYMATRQERLDAYNRDLQDTVDEFKAIVAAYRQSGEPGKSTKNSSAPRPKHRIGWIIGGVVALAGIAWMVVHITGSSNHP